MIRQGDLGSHVAWAAGHSSHVPGTIRVARRVGKLLGETKIKYLDIVSLTSKKIAANRMREVLAMVR